MKIKRFVNENRGWSAVFALSFVVIAVYLVWYMRNPRLRFETFGGPEVVTQIVCRGEKALPPLPGELEYDDFSLEGWYTDRECTERYENEPLYSSKTIYAKWTDSIYTVTYHNDGGRLKGQTVYEVYKNETLSGIEAPEATSGSAYFTGWYTEPECENRFVFGKTKISADTDLYASFGYPTDSIDSLAAPVIYIEGAGGISKDRYSSCSVSLVSEKRKYCAESLGAQIRGRGNSTWGYEKKPYRLKFDEKIDLFGMGKAKDWILLANTVDMSMLRNYTVYKMAGQFAGCRYTTDCMFVHVYIDGDYRGLYLLTDQTEVGSERVDIGDGTDENGNNLAPEECGYLLECGNGSASSGQKTFTPKTVKGISTGYVVIKSPEGSAVTQAHVKYIQDYYNSVQSAIANDDFETLCELVDIQTFVDSFICTEYILSGDMGWVFFAYKEPGGKFCLGPLWDYDQSSGCSEHGGANYSGYVAASEMTWYTKLSKNPEFMALVKQSWEEHYDYTHAIPDMLYATAAKYENDINLNYTRWEGFLGSKQWRSLPQVDALKTYPEHVDYLVEWLNNRVDWIEKDLGIK